MKAMTPTHSHRQHSHGAAFTLIEMLIYISVLMVLIAVGFAALYRSLDSSMALRRNADDIINAIHAGENWRADVRSARGLVSAETNVDGVIFHLSTPGHNVAYRFAANTLFRRIGDNSWSPVLANVMSCTFVPEARSGINGWRCELELQPTRKAPSRLRPLFTFIAVPSGKLAK